MSGRSRYSYYARGNQFHQRFVEIWITDDDLSDGLEKRSNTQRLIVWKLGMADIWNVKVDTRAEVQFKLESIVKSLKRESIIEFMEKAAKENPEDKIQSQFSELIEDRQWQVEKW